MDTSTPFKWCHYQAEIIVLCVRWYLRYPLSYRNLEEMMRERGLSVDYSTIYRWVQHSVSGSRTSSLSCSRHIVPQQASVFSTHQESGKREPCGGSLPYQ